MRWTRASGALMLLAGCLLVSALLIPKGRARRAVSLTQFDREGAPLPPMALARLGGKDRQIRWHTERELPINSACFTPDCHRLILSTADGALRIRDWATGCEKRCWHSAGMGRFGEPLPIDLSPDGR